MIKIQSGSRPGRGRFIEKTLESMVRKTERAFFAEDLAKTDGLLQRLDPRVKIVGLLSLIVAVTLSRNLFTIILIFAIGAFLALFSRVPMHSMAKRVWLGALAFTGVIAIPVVFITAGEPLVQIPVLGWTITLQGVTSALYLISRVEATATLSLLLILCTRWAHVLKALRVLHVPVVFVVILGMTYRYIFVILETARNMFEARKSRLVGNLAGRDRRRVSVATAGVLLTKSFYLHNEVFLAMQSRGFRGEVYSIDDFEMHGRDSLAMGIFVLLTAAVIFLGQQDSFQSLVSIYF